MKKPKQIISEEVLRNMEMLAVTSAAMRDVLEQAMVIYELAGAPEFFEAEADDGISTEACDDWDQYEQEAKEDPWVTKYKEAIVWRKG